MYLRITHLGLLAVVIIIQLVVAFKWIGVKEISWETPMALYFISVLIDAFIYVIAIVLDGIKFWRDYKGDSSVTKVSSHD